MTTKHIGIVACSSEGAALCYRTICLEAAARMGEHFHPEVSLHGHSLGDYLLHIDRGDWDGVAALMRSSAEKLARAGADFFICPDNTIHQAFARASEHSPRPWLHIADVVAGEAARRGFRKLVVLGTRSLMESAVYPEQLGRKKLAHAIPNANERRAIDDAIFHELVNAKFLPETRARFVAIIARLAKEEQCDAVVLGCTEIPLLITENDSPLPALDSTRLLARAALDAAIGDQP